MRAWWRVLAVSILVIGPACGKATPTAPAVETPAMSVPVPVAPGLLVPVLSSPVPDAEVRVGLGVVVLEVAVPAPPTGVAIVDIFEYSYDASFTTVTEHAVPRTTTRTSRSVTFGPSRVGHTLHWRVRSASGEQVGATVGGGRVRLVPDVLRAPVLMDPIDGANVGPDTRFTVTAVTHGTNASWSYEFEFGRDEEFRDKAAHLRVSEGNTSVVGVRPVLEHGRYFWRVRTFDRDGASSEYSPVRRFEIRDAFVMPPVQVAPAPLATVTQSPSFVLGNGEMFGGAEVPRYELQLSASPAFTQILATASGWASTGTTTLSPITNLQAGTYYWRARAVRQKTVSTPEMASEWTDGRPVVLTGVVLGTPTLVEPAKMSTTHARPVMRVTNASTSGIQSGSVMYRFEVSTDIRFVEAPLATGVVPQGAAVTEWTAPYDVPTGIPLYWRVRAEHPSSGTIGAFSAESQFAAVSHLVQRYQLVLQIPASCGFAQQAPTLLIETTSVTAPTVEWRSNDASPHTTDWLTVTLQKQADAVTGTIYGAATDNGRTYMLRASSTGSAPVAVTGTATTTGWTGMGTGVISETLAPISSKTCGAMSFTWAIVRR